MACELSNGELVFDKSGIRVQPREVTIQSSKSRFSHARVKLSRKAGELIRDRAEFGEPCFIKIAGYEQDRYYLAEDAVELKNSESWVTLYDGMKVLETGAISRHFHDTTLENIVDYIFERKDDPHNVVEEVIHPDVEEPIEARNLRGAIFGQDGEEEGLLDSIGDSLEKSVAGVIEWHHKVTTGAEVSDDTAIGFKEDTVLSAIQKIEAQFGFEFWLDSEGALHYLPASVVPTNGFVIGADERAIRIKEYNVVTRSGKINRVRLMGKYRFLNPTPDQSSLPYREVSMGMYAYAEAWVPGMDGSTDAQEEPMNIHEPVPLEYAARRRLLSHFMDHKSGNIVVNSAASEQKDGLAKISVGDTILTLDEIEDHCHREVETGLFVVRAVTHRVNPRQGWETVIEVSGVPSGRIEQKSWLMDPEDNTRYEDIEDYLSEGQLALNQGQLDGQDGE
jgi:hypothetical protein